MINAACPRGFKLHVLQLQLLLNLFLLAFAKAAIVVAKPRGPKFFVFVPRPEDDQKLLLRLPPVFSHATTDVLNKKKVQSPSNDTHNITTMDAVNCNGNAFNWSLRSTTPHLNFAISSFDLRIIAYNDEVERLRLRPRTCHHVTSDACVTPKGDQKDALKE